jgi:hypothetical protein
MPLEIRGICAPTTGAVGGTPAGAMRPGTCRWLGAHPGAPCGAPDGAPACAPMGA